MREQPTGAIVLYQRDDAPAIDVRLDGDTVWLSLNQLADLLGRDKSTISRHIANVFAEGELARDSVVAEFATTAADGKTLQGAGKVSHRDALPHAEAEYAKSRIQQDAQPSEVETASLAAVNQAQQKIEGKQAPGQRSKKGKRNE